MGGNFLKILVEPENADLDTEWQDLAPRLSSQTPAQRAILLFRYNANAAFNTSVAGVRQNADVLLNLLDIKRDSLTRPIVFIAHSLGGVIVKKALVQAEGNAVYRNLEKATLGIVFFGTPHQGSDQTTLGEITANIARSLSFSRTPESGLIESLKKDSFYADEIRSQFDQKLGDYWFLSFFETLSSGKGLGVIVKPKSAKLGLPSPAEILVALDASHSDICKFASEDDDDYQQVVANIVKLANLPMRRPFIKTHTGFQESTRPDSNNTKTLYTDLPTDITGSQFVGRQAILEQLESAIPFARDEHARATLWGLGGCGPTHPMTALTLGIQGEVDLQLGGRDDAARSLLWGHARNMQMEPSSEADDAFYKHVSSPVLAVFDSLRDMNSDQVPKMDSTSQTILSQEGPSSLAFQIELASIVANSSEIDVSHYDEVRKIKTIQRDFPASSNELCLLAMISLAFRQMTKAEAFVKDLLGRIQSPIKDVHPRLFANMINLEQKCTAFKLRELSFKLTKKIVPLLQDIGGLAYPLTVIMMVRLAVQYAAQKKTRLASNLLGKAVPIISPFQLYTAFPRKWRLALLIECAELYRRMERFEDSLMIGELILAAWQEDSGFDASKMDTMMCLYEDYDKVGRFEQMMDMRQQIISLGSQASAQELFADNRMLQHLGSMYLIAGKQDAAVVIYHASLLYFALSVSITHTESVDGPGRFTAMRKVMEKIIEVEDLAQAFKNVVQRLRALDDSANSGETSLGFGSSDASSTKDLFEKLFSRPVGSNELDARYTSFVSTLNDLSYSLDPSMLDSSHFSCFPAPFYWPSSLSSIQNPSARKQEDATNYKSGGGEQQVFRTMSHVRTWFYPRGRLSS